MKRTHILLAALVLGFTLILAGCGSGGGSDDDVASANSSDKKDADDKSSPEDQQEAALKFAKCMREHGVKMDDPKDGRITLGSRKGEEDVMKKAQEACQKYLPPISAEDRKRGNESALKFSQCMRDHGVDKFPDPSDGGLRINKGIAEDPDFKKAQEACQKLMGGPKIKSGDKS